ncbi:hypothetical protein [Pelomicrobium sp. G1]|uniref:hypothetical protein n=1 Tax=unclassified Pelomicrobium TaxID=2815318 RepID=UPI003F766105
MGLDGAFGDRQPEAVAAAISRAVGVEERLEHRVHGQHRRRMPAESLAQRPAVLEKMKELRKDRGRHGPRGE